jgi:hypothetical protein
MRCCAWIAFCLVLLGCGGDDKQGQNGGGGFQSDQTCGLRVELDGALRASFTGAETELACVFPLGPSGLHNTFLAIEGELRTFELHIGELEKGATGEDFAAEVRVGSRDDRAWETSDCSADITEHEYLRAAELSENHRVVGSGSCAAPAPPVSGDSEPVSIQPFDFVAVIAWVGGS